ncbi:MAG: asparagine synthase-related protein [Pseudomonadota bacterium]
MRLICGFLNLNGSPASAARLDRMIAAMTPPGQSPRVLRHVDGSVAMAMLAFGETVPDAMPVGEDGIVLAADIRLDAPAALAEALGRPRSAAPDALLLAALARRDATQGLGDVLGDFAVAAWNPRDRTLLCARDAMGVRPLFVHETEGQLVIFASRPSGIHASGLVARRIDDRYFFSHLVGVAPGPERSLFEDIRRLPPGGWARFSATAAPRRANGSHWRLDRRLTGGRRITPEEAAEEMAALVRQAVRARLSATGPVAAHLSGGLDSASIAVLAHRALQPQGQSLLAYSFLHMPIGTYDPPGERPHVEAVLRQEQDMRWRPVDMGPLDQSLLLEMDRDQLLPVDAGIPNMRACADAAALGATMLLSGWGGDEGATYNGRGLMAEAALRGRWRWLLREARAMAKAQGMSLDTVLGSEVLQYLVPPGLVDASRRMRGKPVRQALSDSARLLVHPDMAHFAPPAERLLRADAARNRYRLLTSPILAQRTEEWALQNAHHGMAAAFPLLDRRVVEFSLSMPSELFLRDGWRRRLYRDAMAGVLPDEVRLNPIKTTPFPELSLRMTAQRDDLLDRVRAWRDIPGVAGRFDLDALDAMLRSFPEPAAAVRSAEAIAQSRDLANKAGMFVWASRHLQFAAAFQDPGLAPPS